MRSTRGDRGITPARSRRYAAALLSACVLLGAGPPAAWSSSTSGPTPPDGSAATTGAPDDAAVTTGAPDDAAVTTQAGPRTQADVRPRLRTLAHPLPPVTGGLLPEAERVAAAVEDELDSDWLGPDRRRSVTIRDALTGEHLVDLNADRLAIPASTTKVLAAAAIVIGLPPETTFTTRVVQGATPDEVVVVAGGDMLLARHEGDPEAVTGRVGVRDLAAETAAALREQGVEGPVTVSLDLTHVPGPQVLETWTDEWVDYGYAGRIVQLGLAEDLALPFLPSPSSPPQEVAAAFREGLEQEGVKVRGSGDEDTRAEEVTVAPDAPELARGESAPLRDVLAHALATSDNAMLEQLARQAAVASGRSTDQAEVAAWMVEVIGQEYDVDLTGVTITDASGLSDGTRIPVRVVADVLEAGTNGSRPHLQEVLAAGGLPIAGYTGTLASRFHLPIHEAAIGNARAKTGSLPGVTSLAGTVVTADGRLLVYAMTADRIGEDGAVLEARSVLDEIVAQLARCGC